MKLEFSAGGIVIRKQKLKTFVLVCRHSGHHGWVFPKGLIGDHIQNETKEDTAIREVEEETGARGKIVKQLPSITFWYEWEGVKIKKTVYYYLMDYISGDITKHDFEMDSVEWLPVNEVEERLTYNSDKKAWNKAKQLITENI